jgi:signal peptidase II
MPKVKFFQSGLCWLWITIIILILDRFTKGLALQYLSAYTALAVTPGFNLTLSFNTGAAFSFLDGASGWQVWFFGAIATAVSIGMLVWLRRISWRESWTAIAVCLVIGGAIGNLSDRILYGHVIDFIQLYVANFYWPAFNIADSAICMGAVMLGLGAFRKAY